MIHPGMLGNLPQSKYGQEGHPVLPTAPQDRRENSTPKPLASSRSHGPVLIYRLTWVRHG